MAAISACDIALWDIAGKSYGVPSINCWRAFRQRVQAYATGFLRLQRTARRLALGEEALAHWEAGFTAMRLKAGLHGRDIAVIQGCDAPWADRAVTLMVDANHCYGVADALHSAALEPLKRELVREPVAPEIMRLPRAEVRARIPIAEGKRSIHSTGFREIAKPTLASISFSPTSVRLADSPLPSVIALSNRPHGIPSDPHVWGSLCCRPPRAQLIAAIPVDASALFAEDRFSNTTVRSIRCVRRWLREPSADKWLIEISPNPDSALKSIARISSDTASANSIQLVGAGIGTRKRERGGGMNLFRDILLSCLRDLSDAAGARRASALSDHFSWPELARRTFVRPGSNEWFSWFKGRPRLRVAESLVELKPVIS